MTFNSFLKQPVGPQLPFSQARLCCSLQPMGCTTQCPTLCQLCSEGTQFEHGLQRVALLGRLWNRKQWSLSRRSKSLGINPETLELVPLPVHSASCGHVFSTMSPSVRCFCQVFLQEQKSNSDTDTIPRKLGQGVFLHYSNSDTVLRKLGQVLHRWAESPIVCAWGNCLQRIKWQQT